MDRERDPWTRLAELTPARIALGRSGVSQRTQSLLAFEAAHAAARDAVHSMLDVLAMRNAIVSLGLDCIELASEAADRDTYLRRPDLGRQLDAASLARLRTLNEPPCDLAIAICDGLSAEAVTAHGAACLSELLSRLAAMSVTVGPIALVSMGRVAVGDMIGAAMKARLVLVLIGERPGLSASDSVGAYLTYDPQPGRHDAERNCVSNIRTAGLSPAVAAAKLAWLIQAAIARKLTGVKLKDESGTQLPDASQPVRLTD
jgi:ethanolamine ammonia-lyase small subunit